MLWTMIGWRSKPRELTVGWSVGESMVRQMVWESGLEVTLTLTLALRVRLPCR